MRQQQILIPHGEFDYVCVVARPAVLSIRKIGRDSGIPFEVRFDDLPNVVKEKIIKTVGETHD